MITEVDRETFAAFARGESPALPQPGAAFTYVESCEDPEGNCFEDTYKAESGPGDRYRLVRVDRDGKPRVRGRTVRGVFRCANRVNEDALGEFLRTLALEFQR